MKKIRMCLALTMAIAMIFAGCGQAATTSSESEEVLAGKEDIAIKGEVNVTTSKDEDTTGGGSGSSGDSGSSEYSGNAFGDFVIKEVKTKDYTIKAKGSEYADGIMLPKLSKKQAKISFVTNQTWKEIENESTDTAPTAYYHAMKIWKEVYGVEVEIEKAAWGEGFKNLLITSVVSGESPEVVRWVDGNPSWIQNNLVTTLDDKLDLTDEDYDIDYMKLTAALNGHVYAAYGDGMDMPTYILAYNKTKFQNAGVDDPLKLYKAGKWNFTQFTKTAKSMTDAANDEYGLAGTGVLFANNFLLMNLNDDATVSLNIREPRFIKSMQAVWNFYHVEKAGRNKDDARATFPLGKDAMAMCSMQDYCRMMDTAKANGTTDEFGVVPLPAYDFIDQTKPYGRPKSMLAGLCISAKPVNMEGAVEFVRLATKVAANISEKLGEGGWSRNYLTAEEKKLFSKVEYFNYESADCTLTLDGALEPLNDLKYAICLSPKAGSELTTVLANAESKLTAVINEYEINAGLRK